MGIVFKKDETPIPVGQMGSSGSSGVTGRESTLGVTGVQGTSGGSNYGTYDFHNDETYYKQIIWNMGEQISQLKEENKTLLVTLTQIKNLVNE